MDEIPGLPNMPSMDLIISFGVSFITVIVILILGWIASGWANRLVLRAARSRKLDEALSRFMAQIVQYTVLAAAVIAALDEGGIETTSLVAIFASAGLAVGLALQGSLSNFASGVMILFFRPFDLGDVINGGGHTGAIVDIGLFSTTLNTPDNHTIIIPNSTLTGGSITNYTKLGSRRTTIDFGVAYGADIDQVVSVVSAAAKGLPNVLEEPGIGVAFTEMAASSLNFKLFVWTANEHWLATQHIARKATYDALSEAGIDIPFDQIVVHNAPPEG
ncbi:MAG: mechanosensitive ion channel domain-containing protein [Myxococcota bacterium]